MATFLYTVFIVFSFCSCKSNIQVPATFLLYQNITKLNRQYSHIYVNMFIYISRQNQVYQTTFFYKVTFFFKFNTFTTKLLTTHKFVLDNFSSILYWLHSCEAFYRLIPVNLILPEEFNISCMPHEQTFFGCCRLFKQAKVALTKVL